MTPHLTLDHLHAFAGSFPENVRENHSALSLYLAIQVLHFSLGDEWLQRYVFPETAVPGLLKLEPLADYGQLQEDAFRVIDLAEVLFNLQHVAGFDSCVRRLRDGNIEGTHAELYFGRLLAINGANFRYVKATGVKRSDFDIEIQYPDGLLACADSKCQIDEKQFDPKKVRSALGKARKQLPDNKPGIIFVKVPEHWLEPTEAELVKSLRETAHQFLQETGRVVSVKYYVSVVSFDGQGVRHKHGFIEINNPKNRFDQTRNWGLFRSPRPDWRNGVPPTWQRVMFFPTGKRDLKPSGVRRPSQSLTRK